MIYSKKLWVIAFPCVMYIGSVGMYLSCSRTTVTLRADVGGTAMGIILIYQTTTPITSTWFGLPYLSISLSLNVILTLMIVVRLILHGKNIRAATGSSAGIGGLYKTISTMLIESCALYAVTSILVVGPQNGITTNLFMPILAENQVRAPNTSYPRTDCLI